MWQWILNTTGGDQQEANHNQDNREVRFGLLNQLKKVIGKTAELYEEKHRQLENYDEVTYVLSQTIEKCLIHGLCDEKDTLPVTFFDVLLKAQGAINRNKPEHLLISKAIQKAIQLRKVKTNLGRSRAWVRMSLNDSGLLAKSIGFLLSNECSSIIDIYYKDFALLRSSEVSSVMMALISMLKDVQFNLLADDEKMDEVERSFSANMAKLVDSFGLNSFMDTMETAVGQVSKAVNVFNDSSEGSEHWQDVFGISLEEIVTNPHQCDYATINPEIGIPNIISQCVAILKKECDTPRLFRSYVTRERLDRVKEYIRSHGNLPNPCDTDIAAAILLQFLREMPDCLLTMAKYEAFIACIELEDDDTCIRNVSLLINDLPSSHRPTLLKLLELLHFLQSGEHGNKNGLNAIGISTIFSPLILRNHALDWHNIPVLQNQEMRLAAIGSDVIERMIGLFEPLFNNLQLELQPQYDKIALKEKQIQSICDMYFIKVSFEESEHEDLVKEIWEILKVHSSALDPDISSNATTKKDEEDNSEGEIDIEIMPSTNKSPKRASYSRNSLSWKNYGFGQSDITLAFESSGLLYLQSLHYFVSTYGQQALQIMSFRTAHEDKSYPFIILGARAVEFLFDTLKLSDLAKDFKFSRNLVMLSKQPFWEMMSDRDFFFKLFSFFCFLFENHWRDMDCNMNFKQTLTESEQQLVWLIDRIPHTVEELWQVWFEVRQQQFDSGSSRYPHSPTSRNQESGSPVKKFWDDTTFTPMLALQRLSSSYSARSTAQRRRSISMDNENKSEFGISYEEDGAQEHDPVQQKWTKTSNGMTTKLMHPSSIITAKMAQKIEDALPMVSQSYHWKLLYSIPEHGASLHTLLMKVKDQMPTLLLIRTSQGHTFGAYTNVPWHVNPDYYGTGESFVFSFRAKNPRDIDVYHWDPKSNSYFMLCTENEIALGGGGHFAFYLDADLHKGSSGNCETFACPSLAKEDHFFCINLEAWGFSCV